MWGLFPYIDNPLVLNDKHFPGNDSERVIASFCLSGETFYSSSPGSTEMFSDATIFLFSMH